MALPVAGMALTGGAALAYLAWRAVGWTERFIGYLGAMKLADELKEEITLQNLVADFVKDPQKQKVLLDLMKDPNGLGPVVDFTEFLKAWNLKLIERAVRASVFSPDWGRMYGQIVSSIQWSYGLGWLSWVGMSPILNHIVAEPADRALSMAFPQKSLTKSEIEKAFKTGIFDESRLRSELKAMGYKDEAINVILSLIRENKVEKDKDLTKSEVLRAYKEGVLDEATTRKYLEDLGYSGEEITVLLALYNTTKEAEKKVREKDLTYSQIIRAYKLGIIRDRGYAKQMLMKIGYDEDEAEILLKVADAEKEASKHEEGRDLTKTDILKAMEEGLITPDQAKQMLMDIGYDEDEAELLIYTRIVKVIGGE